MTDDKKELVDGRPRLATQQEYAAALDAAETPTERGVVVGDRVAALTADTQLMALQAKLDQKALAVQFAALSGQLTALIIQFTTHSEQVASGIDEVQSDQAVAQAHQQRTDVQLSLLKAADEVIRVAVDELRTRYDFTDEGKAA